MRMPLTIFMFGYWGWGNATGKLVEAVDAVEKERGYEPPLFVDVRIHRDARATGFHGAAFERTVGKRRYEWMNSLGNLSQRKDLKKFLQETYICDPSAAEILLERAYECARHGQRIIYFCSCEWPHECHRRTVAGLIVKTARRQGRSIEVVEWPGGKPTVLKKPIEVSNTRMPTTTSPKLRLKRVRPFPLAKYAGLAYGSRVRVDIRGNEQDFAVGPAKHDTEGWYLPVLRREISIPITPSPTAIDRYREDWNYDPLRSKK